MRRNKTSWAQLAALVMLFMQAAGLHAHISTDAGALSVQGHVQVAESHADSHASESEPSDDAPKHWNNSARAQFQSSLAWVLPVCLAYIITRQSAPAAAPDFPDRNARPRSIVFYQRPPSRGPPANA